MYQRYSGKKHGNYGPTSAFHTRFQPLNEYICSVQSVVGQIGQTSEIYPYEQLTGEYKAEYRLGTSLLISQGFTGTSVKRRRYGLIYLY
jgi:hypothetical protein